MGWTEFEYSTLSTDAGVYRPYLRVNVHADQEEILIFALVDSGGEITMLHLSLARALGIDLGKCKKVKVGGVGGSGRIGYESSVLLTFPDFPNISLESPVIFAECQAEALLGQDNFFANVKVLFEGHTSTFQLNPLIKIPK